MNSIVSVLAAAYVAFFAVPAFAQESGQFLPAELPNDTISDEYGTAKVLMVYREINDNVAGYDHITQKLHLKILSGPGSGEE